MAGGMAVDFGEKASASSCWATLSALTDADGSAKHPLVALLLRPRTPMRMPARLIADAVHMIGLLHGRHPGIIDHAAARAEPGAMHVWLTAAAEGFAHERGYLTRLVSAVGPMPSTPGQAESETAVAAQRHALDMLGGSDRQGCATGAAVAVILDWQAMRAVLDAAAERFGVTVSPCALPTSEATAAMVGAAPMSPAVERAMAFAVQQVLAQHRALWGLIESRASARGDL